MKARERLRRALLFMPGDDLKKIRKGTTLGADSIIMDLEDGVALNNKEAARRTIFYALTSGEVDFGTTERLVRINPVHTGWQFDDIRATIDGVPDGYVVPKAESAREIALLSQSLLGHELRVGLPPRSIALLPIIETARGIVNLREIAQADSRLVALIFGAEDLASSLGAIRSEEGQEVFVAKSLLVLHAAAYGLQAIDTPYIKLQDEAGLVAVTSEAMRMGYTGKLAIHPAQVAPIIGVFTPTIEEIAYAEALIKAHDAHQVSGTGVFAYEGKMVDMPMIKAAERILARANATHKT